MATESFVWGAGGAKLTPEQIALARQLLARKNMQGADTSPVGHWTQGAARVADALGDVIQSKRLDAAEKDNTSYNSDLLSGLLTGGGASASIPAPAAAGEMAATAPKYDAAPVTANGEVADYIRQSAAARGIDPDIALRVAISEGGVNDPVRQSLVVKNGVREPSYGPFQLYMGGGLGNKALAAGIDPRDPNQWKQGVDFALDQAKSGGWSPWYGAKKIGVTGMMGIGNSPIQPVAAAPVQVAPNQVASLDPSAGMPMPGAAGQMRASDPAQVMPPQAVVSAPPLPPATTVAAPPPVASVPAVAPAPVQGVQVAQDTGVPGPTLAAAMKVLSDPRANANTRAIAEIIIRKQQERQQAILEQQMKQADPGYQADLKLKQLQADQIANPRLSPADEANIGLNRDKFTFEKESSQLTPDIKEYKFAKDNGYAGSFAQYQVDLKKASANNTTINNGEGNKFYNTLDEQNAKIFSGLSDAGIQGRSKLGQIDQLENLLNSGGTGAMAVLKQRAGDLGINTEGLSDIQAASAMLSKMIPEQRAPGSGPVSDADLAGFRNSLPRLINQPGGNATIINTMRGLTQYQIAMGTIADRVANREITPAEGRAQIANLPNPLSNFKAPPPGKEDEGWQELSPGVRVRKVK